MKLVFDENLSVRLVERIADLYPGSAHVRDLGLLGAPDDEIWTRAAQTGFVVVSKDADFFQRAVLFGPPPKVVWLRIGNGPPSVAADLLRRYRDRLGAFEADPASAWIQLPD